VTEIDQTVAGASPAGPPQTQIEARISEFLVRELRVDAQRLAAATDIYEGGLVDSIGVIELLTFLEGEYGIEIPEDDLLSGDFSRIDGIAGIVARLASEA
jgi:acyl carrier protein